MIGPERRRRAAQAGLSRVLDDHDLLIDAEAGMSPQELDRFVREVVDAAIDLLEGELA